MKLFSYFFYTIGIALSAVLAWTAWFESSWLYGVKSLTAVAVTASLYRTLKQAEDETVKNRNFFKDKKKQILLGLIIGVAVPLVLIWLVVLFARR
jgi:Na+-translocating ferredoxin:NAD+ oxidoreductase RnfD subunit